MATGTGRNSPCPCGSGRKFKKCCMARAGASAGTGRPDKRTLAKAGPSREEPHLSLVPSLVYQGQRLRAVANRLHFRPENETFHEFLLNVIKWTLGRDWWKHQVAMQPDQRHVVVKWNCDYAEFNRRTMTEENRVDATTFRAEAPGPVWALGSLGYDLYCLQAKNALPDHLVKKLRNHQDFQAARYEVAVAAIMTRAGFEPTFLDIESQSKKHCEFIARDRYSGAEVGVEAKSRRRPGVLHEKGEFSYKDDWKGVSNLIRKAKKQKPAGMPFLIFVDVNMPLTPEKPVQEKPWMLDMKHVQDQLGTPSAENPDPFNALVVTNFAHYYGDGSTPALSGEWGIFVSRFPEVPAGDGRLISAVMESLQRYDHIPREI